MFLLRYLWFEQTWKILFFFKTVKEKKYLQLSKVYVQFSQIASTSRLKKCCITVPEYSRQTNLQIKKKELKRRKNQINLMEQHGVKNINSCWNTKITFYLETSGGRNYNTYLNIAHFSTPVLIRYLWQLKTVVFMHGCLLRAVLLKTVIDLILMFFLPSFIWVCLSVYVFLTAFLSVFLLLSLCFAFCMFCLSTCLPACLSSCLPLSFWANVLGPML
jgi:hypothetical protein